MANFRVWDRLPMTDTWLNQGGDASMATMASREVSTMPVIKLDIHNPDRRKDPEIRSRGKEQGHESSKG